MLYRNKKTKLEWDVTDKDMLKMVANDTETFEPVAKKGKGRAGNAKDDEAGGGDEDSTAGQHDEETWPEEEVNEHGESVAAEN